MPVLAAFHSLYLLQLPCKAWSCSRSVTGRKPHRNNFIQRSSCLSITETGQVQDELSTKLSGNYLNVFRKPSAFICSLECILAKNDLTVAKDRYTSKSSICRSHLIYSESKLNPVLACLQELQFSLPTQAHRYQVNLYRN